MSRTELPRRPAVKLLRRPAGRAWISPPLGEKGEEGRGEEMGNEREEKE